MYLTDAEGALEALATFRSMIDLVAMALMSLMGVDCEMPIDTQQA